MLNGYIAPLIVQPEEDINRVVNVIKTENHGILNIIQADAVFESTSEDHDFSAERPQRPNLV